MRRTILALCIFLSALGLDAQSGSQFREYWYSQKAELTRYDLQQARYGEIHKGEAVLIFVTEPFLIDKQVKYEHGDKSNSISVLKLNSTRKFFTGIYPYSMMTSTFTPVDYSKHKTLKVTSTSQEWCGHTFMQMNLRKNNYDAILRSYFQDEGDRNFQLPNVLLEDEIWTRLRLAPESLPTGEIDLIPSLQFTRLQHKDLKAEKAAAKVLTEGKANVYSLDYKNLKRSVRIKFQKDFPYQILGWEETTAGGFGNSAPLTTKAVKTKTILLDYWNRNGVEDAHFRKELGLTEW